jgi:Bacterial Ig-like domain
VSYSALEAALVANADAIGDTAAAANIPTTSPVSGNWWLSTAEAQALGLSNVGGNPDGYIGFSSSVSFSYNDSNGVPLGQYDFFGVVAHEITEVMGRQMMDGENFQGGTSYEPLDLFHYSAAGVPDFSGTTAGYFSPDGGTTHLGSFNTNPSGDFGDWAASVGNNSFLAFSNSGVVDPVTANDLAEMNLLGWDPATSGGAPVVTIALANDTSGGKDITANDALTGTADPNATVTISEGSTVLGTTTASVSGVWSFTPTGLAQGLQTVTASETNAAGLTGSSSLTFTYETTAPTVTIALADDTSGGKEITSYDALTGTADPNATVKISEGSTVLGTTTANANGVWSFTPTSLAQGMQTITASETNAAGLTSYSYLTFTYKTTTSAVTSGAIDLSHSEFADLAAVHADLHANINSAGLTLDATDSITLTHLQIHSLHAQSFHFF